ncbi:hypothetical protein chiPu_0006465 [Chiloscyllium punctatum]|uniref:Uncharacterized protein n=1 Tax=Chiloscyllium punctatum TaxID=137246 RepID=A0A401SCA4_CHIPU|nr:hypothetical protein [Chiloscyllium punctatum]
MNKGTAVEILGRKFPVVRDNIVKTSEKWGKRTKKLLTKWPKDGTFDMHICNEMEGLIKNYKPRDKSKKRHQKRDQEMEILKLFRREGEELREVSQASVVMGRGAKEQTKLSQEIERQEKELSLYPDVKELGRPPPYSDEEAMKQCPMKKGTVEIRGQLEWEKSKEDRNKLREKREAERRERQEEIEAVQCVQEELRHEIDVLRMLREQKEYKEYLDCKRKVEQGRGEGDSVKIEEHVEKQVKKGAQMGLVGRVWEELEIESESESDGESSSDGLSMGKRSQRGKTLPPLIKGGRQPQYVPWGTQDLEVLKNVLPNLHEGAGKWIRAFEDETTGQLLAMGDLKALLVRLMGRPKLKEIMDRAGLKNVVDNPMVDGARFDRVRQRVWQALRDCYPPKMDSQALRGDPLGDNENLAAYLKRQLRKWRLETEQDIEGNQLLTTMFRNSIIEAMPSQVRSRLEEVVGLTSSMSHQEFRDHVAHAVERFRKTKEKLSEQQEEVQRKLAQMQLEELKKKEKEKGKKSFLVRITTRQLVVISSTAGHTPSSDKASPLYYYDLATASVRGTCPDETIDVTSEERAGLRL